MAPYHFPDEIDVFSAPHTRMKELVNLFRLELSSTDYQNESEVKVFLQNLHSTFLEFKSHEDIENRYIMENLKTRMNSNDKLNSVVCKCHENSHLSEILEYVENGSVVTVADKYERMSYLNRLKNILNDFISTFLPHMKEEEEIFQPLLMKYFEYEELRDLKSKIMKLHEEYKDLLWIKLNVASEGLIKIDESDIDFQSEAIHTNSKEECSKALHFMDLPLEVQVKIMSYLTPKERFKCSEVSKSWRNLLYFFKFWNVLSPLNWIKNLPDEIENDPTFLFNKYQLELQDDEDETMLKEVRTESMLFNSLVACHLPFSGVHVKKCILTGSICLTSDILCGILSHCVNVEWLDVAYTKIEDAAFHGLSKKGCLAKLRHLDLSGCERITDSTLERVVQCYVAGSIQEYPVKLVPYGLEYLGLSGCFEITSAGLDILRDCSFVTRGLYFLDVSGCFRIKGCSLSQLVYKCPKLSPGDIYYCDYITDGPYQKDANGCQNLHDSIRACCSKCP